ncbi:hypothetical protein B9Z55_026282 [Caenorhabditis nigoni]|uniref:Uncharacterized protein n=1 Tax=Caenorhabditis nigoni TaxID=1611254 RepID=A0A2G5T2M2_9PELO|nr:hypothetical protein B9Z55_026282 [Caenorhabditis nigoni]
MEKNPQKGISRKRKKDGGIGNREKNKNVLKEKKENRKVGRKRRRRRWRRVEAAQEFSDGVEIKKKKKKRTMWSDGHLPKLKMLEKSFSF